jgi:hypothetical protein
MLNTDFNPQKKIFFMLKENLGYKSINSTIIYNHLMYFEPEEYPSRNAKNIMEAQKLVDAGFEYVSDSHEEGKLFRIRK